MNNFKSAGCFAKYAKSSAALGNTMVLTMAEQDSTAANRTLSVQFGPLPDTFRSEGSVIDDIRTFMTEPERELYSRYRSLNGNN